MQHALADIDEVLSRALPVFGMQSRENCERHLGCIDVEGDLAQFLDAVRLLDLVDQTEFPQQTVGPFVEMPLAVGFAELWKWDDVGHFLHRAKMF